MEYNQLNPDASLNMQYVIPSGVVVLNEDGDKDLIIASLEIVQALFDVKGRVSGLELQVDPDDLKDIEASIETQLGEEVFGQKPVGAK